MKTLKSIIVAALCAVGLSASALPPSPYRDIWSSTPDPCEIKDPTSIIDWGMSSRTFESPEAKHGKFLEASADAMIAAYSARIAKDDTDYEAYICRAFAYLKKAGENQAFFDLAQEFGYTFDNDTMHFTGELIQKKGVTPEMNDATAEICDILLPLMKSAYADLVAIPYNWKGCVAITPDIYPVDEAVYFDYADVLMAKTGLAEMMCILNMVKGFDVTMDSDLLEYTFNSRSPKNGKRGVQPILENNPDFFSKVRDQKAATEAGDWWASAATLLDQWDKAHAKRSDGKQHFFDWNFEKMDDNTVQCYDWLHKHRDGLINMPYWASPFDWTLMNGDKNQFWTFQPLFAGKFLREHFPEFGVGVKEPWCNEPLLDTLPDSTLCGMFPGVSRTYIGNLMTNVARAGDFTTIPPYTPDSASSEHAIWYDNLFELGFDNTGNPAMFAWESQSPLVLLDPEFNVRGVTAVFTGWSFSGYTNGVSNATWEGDTIPTPFPKEHAKYNRRNVVATANFTIPKVTYLDFEGGKLSERTDECEIVKADTTTFEAGKVYAVPVDVTIPDRITVSGTPAKLVLCDGVTLSAANGVEVADGSALIICGQALGTGMLEATGSSGAAGIGGGGTVTINGGTVIATGGSSGSGIGGGTVTINAGTVTAVGGSSAAGIAGTVKFADGTAYGVAAGADEANALYMTAAAYAADHSAAYVTLPCFSLKIPETDGCSYEVSCAGVESKAALAGGVNTYAIATGATVKVHFTLEEDYVFDGPFENPMIIANLSGDTVVDAADLPTVKFAKKGSAENPWTVGKTTLDSVTAWTNETDKLVVEGEGVMKDFDPSSDPAPWGTGITEVEIGENVTGIGANAFAGSTSLSSVTVEAMTPPALGDGAFAELPEGFDIYVPTGTSAAYKAAPGWSDYADRIFEGKPGSPTNPWKVGAPNADDVIAYTNGVGELVVEGSGDMKDFDPPSDPAPWGTGITEVEIGDGVTGIGANAFNDSRLGSVTIPASVTSIGAAAFFCSTSLSNVTVEAMTPPALGEGAFVEVAEGYKIAVPMGTSAAYKAATDWSLYADSIFEQGSPECPWEIGEGVEAYLNGTELVIQGAGTISDLSKISDDVKRGIGSITISTNEVTGAEADVFAGIGGEGDVAVTLPDGWQGELPDEDGNWYGMTGVTLTRVPLAVKNVTFLQRYPWNGKVDIGFGVTGPEGEKDVAVTVRNGETEVTNFTAAVTVPASGVLEAKLLWNAADLGDDFQSDDVTVEVAIQGAPMPQDGQLWAGGPIWEESNIGESENMDHPEYGALYKFDNATNAVAQLTDGRRLPTKDELQALIDNCDSEWDDTKKGYTFTGRGDYAANSIFFPAAGYDFGSGRSRAGEDGYYWSATPDNMEEGRAYSLDISKNGGVEVIDGDFGYGSSVRTVRDTPPEVAPAESAISAKSAVGTVDLRTRVELAEGETTVPAVTWSATLWGELDEEFVTAIGWTNLTTGATGVFSNLAGVVGDAAEDVDLPKKDGDYVLTHSTGDLKSLAAFVVSGYPLGSESNPWKVGPADDSESTVAWTDGDGTVYFKPPRSSVSREGLATITNAMGGTGFDMALVSADSTATNDVKMIIGAGGKQYTTFEDMLASDDDSFKFFDVTGCVVSYDGMGAAGEMMPDTFLPGVPTNLTANAFTAVGYEFQGWATNGGTRIVFRDRAAIDDPQPGDIYELTAVWKSAPVKVTTFEQLRDALAAAAQQGAELSASINISGKITVPYGEKVELPGDPSKAEIVLTGSGTIEGYVKKGGNLVVSTNVKVLPWTVGNGVTARLDENGTLHIEGKGKMNDFTDANPAPWAGVASDIKAIEVAEGVTKIGNAAFEALDYAATTTALTFQDEDHVLNLLAFMSADGSKTNAPLAKAFSVYKDSSGTVEPIVTFQTPDQVYVYTKAPVLMRYGYDEVLLLTLPDLKAVQTAELIGAAGETPYSKTMQGLLDEALDKIDKATNYDEVMDGYVERWNQIVAQAAKDESHTIAGTKITWRVLDGSLVIEGEGEMPGFVEPDYPEGAPWNGRKADITSATVAAGVTSVGDAAFAVCPSGEGASVLFKDPALELNLGAFVSGDGSATNVPTVKVEVVTDDGRTLRVAPGGWTDADDPNVTYDSLAEAIENGATAVTAAFEKKTDVGDVVVPPTEVEEIVTVTDGTGAKTELTAKFVNDANGLGSDGEVGLATDVENIAASVEALSSNIVVTVKLESSGTMDVALSNECESVKAGFAPDAATLGFVSHNFDIDVAWSYAGAGGELTELPYSIVAHIPMTVYDGFVYSVSRLHGGAFEALPEWTAETADSATAEWFKVDVANGEIVIKTRLFCPFAIGVLELEKSCTVTVNDGSKTLGEADPSSLATNIEIVVTGPINKSDFAGYAKRKAGEATGAYPINFVMTEKMPAGFPAGSFTVIPGVFTILMGDGPAATGTVKYPATYKTGGVDTGLLREKASASWAATADKGSVFAGWIAAEGAPECVTNKLAVLTENELRKSPLAFRVEVGEQIAPTDVEATWARIDEDTIESVTIDTNGLHVTTKSFVTASVSGLPSGLRFNAKTLAITGAVKAADKTYSVKVSVKNASGYTWKQSFGFTVVNNAVTEIVPADDCVTTGVPVMVRCDPAMGKVNGTGVYALGRDGTKKVSISATAKPDYVFAGWYKDPGFSEPAEFWIGSGKNLKQKDYRETSQLITVTGPTYLYARFVEKSTTADPIVWLRYIGAGYCGSSASFLDEEETWYQGVALPTNACMIAFDSASLPTVSVSGLPSGVKFDKNTLRFTGVPTTASTEKKPFFTVKISVKNKSGSTDLLVRNVKVEPLPAWAVGNFDGYHIEDGATNGTFTATVGKNGRVSGKTVGGYAATTFSAANFVDVFTLDGSSLIYAVDVTVSYRDPSTRKTVKQVDTLYLMEDPETGLGTIGGGDGDGCGAVGVQRAWDRKDLAFPAFDTTALRTPFALDNGITLKFGAKGKVTVAGKVTGDDGSPVSVSGSTYVLPLAWRSTMTPNLLSEVYVFSASKRNLVEGVSEMYGFLLSVGEGGKFDTLSPVPQELMPEIHAGPVVPIIH